jgi:cytochrome bd-type quinol oxidase subunit 2
MNDTSSSFPTSSAPSSTLTVQGLRKSEDKKSKAWWVMLVSLLCSIGFGIWLIYTVYSAVKNEHEGTTALILSILTVVSIVVFSVTLGKSESGFMGLGGKKKMRAI